ncbi:MAG TPA: hypothetical protein VFP65_22060, partial [Anaeromyxobacteraceae bacterium]|nr:hypothetical protein [Anaeromyxobacteraceae bacterium]
DVRAAAERGRGERALRRAAAGALVRAAARIPYTDRTWPRVLAAAAPVLDPPARAWLTRLVASGPPDPKGDDARATLAAAEAFVRSGAPAIRAPPRRPSSLVRRRKLVDGATATSGGPVASRDVLAALGRGADAEALRDEGLRRAVVAGLARALGLRAGDEERAAALGAWLAARGVVRGREKAFLAASGLDAADTARLADDLALERALLLRAAEAVPDGPSALEGLALGARLAGRWAEVARRIVPARRGARTLQEASPWGRSAERSHPPTSRSTRRSRGSRTGSG